MREPPDELHAYLAAFAPEIAVLFFAARATVLRAAPDANELIYDAYNAVSAAYSFTGRLREGFCHVAAYSRYVNLGFNRGVELVDPTGLLVGTGARIRHVRIATPSDLQRPALAKLVRAAVAQGRAAAGSEAESAKSVVRPVSGAKRRPRRAKTR